MDEHLYKDTRKTDILNTDDKFGLIAKFFHWSIAVMVLGILPVGLYMTGMENSPLKFEVYALHKSFGLLVFFMGLARIVWRFVTPAPDAPDTHKPWERALAGAAHFWLYVCVIGMPLTGWMMSSASEFPVPFFGAHLPWIIGKDENLAGLFGQAHEILAYTLMFVLVMHVGGALKHHFIDKDDTLARMTWKCAAMSVKQRFGMAFGIFLVIGLVIAVAAILWLQSNSQGNITQETASAAPSNLPVVQREIVQNAVRVTQLPQDGWAIVAEQSNLTFTASMYQTPFTGTFKDFEGEIIFNPDDLESAKADIRIGLDNVSTGDGDRDSNIIGADWFDVAREPDAYFKTVSFEHVEGNSYIAIGDLTIRGVTMPVTLPFTLDISGDTAKMKGATTLNRLDFGMGTGTWEDDKSVGHDVTVNVDLTAIR